MHSVKIYKLWYIFLDKIRSQLLKTLLTAKWFILKYLLSWNKFSTSLISLKTNIKIEYFK